jgi:hypothetical protein
MSAIARLEIVYYWKMLFTSIDKHWPLDHQAIQVGRIYVAV